LPATSWLIIIGFLAVWVAAFILIRRANKKQRRDVFLKLIKRRKNPKPKIYKAKVCTVKAKIKMIKLRKRLMKWHYWEFRVLLPIAITTTVALSYYVLSRRGIDFGTSTWSVASVTLFCSYGLCNLIENAMQHRRG
jgi:hypothetical protein